MPTKSIGSRWGFRSESSSNIMPIAGDGLVSGSVFIISGTGSAGGHNVQSSYPSTTAVAHKIASSAGSNVQTSYANSTALVHKNASALSYSVNISYPGTNAGLHSNATGSASEYNTNLSYPGTSAHVVASAKSANASSIKEIASSSGIVTTDFSGVSTASLLGIRTAVVVGGDTLYPIKLNYPGTTVFVHSGGAGSAASYAVQISYPDTLATSSTSGTGQADGYNVGLHHPSTTALAHTSTSGSAAGWNILLQYPDTFAGATTMEASATGYHVETSYPSTVVTKSNETHKTIIWQYENSPIINQIVNDFQAALDKNVLTNNFISLIWDVRTANSYGVDILGRIVGVGRYLSLTDNSYLGFADGFGAWNEYPFFHGEVVTTQLRLGDDQYRKVILAKAANNISGGSIPAIENVLKLLFGDKGKSSVRVDGHLLLSYLFYWTPEPIDLAIIQAPNLLPQPAGHIITKSFV